MSEGATGQPVEVPAESPGPAQTATPVTSNGAGTPPSGNGSHGEGSAPGAVGPGDADVSQEGRDPNGARTQSRRRRGSRGGRGRSSSTGPRAHDDGADGRPDAAVSVPPVPTGAGGSPAPSPGVAPERPKIGDSRPARPVAEPAAGATANGGGDTRRRPDTAPAGRGEGRGGSGGRSRQRPAVPVEGPAAGARGQAGARPEGRRGGRERRGKAVGRYMICVHVRPEATQIALLEGRTLVEHYVSRASDDATQIDGNIYRGRVQNVLPGMEAAFIDIGTPKNAVLYHGDVRYDTDDVETGGAPGQPRIEQLLRPGQTILC